MKTFLAIEEVDLERYLAKATVAGYNMARGRKPTGIWLNVNQVAEVFGVCAATVRTYLKKEAFNVEGKCRQRRKSKTFHVELLDSNVAWSDVGDKK